MNEIVVGITQRALPPTEHGELRDGLDRRWFDFLAACRLLPVPLPNSAPVAVLTATRLHLRGLILTGGDDLQAYGGPVSGRDETERALITWALLNHVPILGVCRGAQMLLTHYGAELERVDGHVAATHRVNGMEGLCYHRWAASVQRLPHTVIATGQVGEVLEAFSIRNERATGIMWHPERADTPPAHDVARFRKTFGAT